MYHLLHQKLDWLHFGTLRDQRHCALCLGAKLASKKKNLNIHDYFTVKTAHFLTNRVGGKSFLEENENKLVSISVSKKSAKFVRFKDISMSV